MVDATWPWPGWGNLRRVFFVFVGLLLLLAFFFFADMAVMLPSSMVFVFAVGPVMSLSRIKPTCLRCGGQVTATALRVVPNVAESA